VIVHVVCGGGTADGWRVGHHEHTDGD
jgi:hypothetical protein